MPYYKNNEIHAFRKIEQDLKGRGFPRVVLLCGPERFLVDFYASKLGRMFTEESTRMLDLVTLQGDSLSLQAIIEASETVSMLSPRKVVLVPDFPPAEGKKLKGFSENDIKSLIEYIKDEKNGVPESTLLIFTAGEGEGGKKVPALRKAISDSKFGHVYDFQPLDDSLLRGFIDKRLRNSGKKYHPAIVSRIIAQCGYGNKYIEYTLYNLDNDIRKLTALAAEEITEADVAAAISPNPENNIFQLLDNVAGNRKGAAILMLHNLLENKTEPFRIQAMIVSQLELILMVKEMSEHGSSLKTMGDVIKDIEHRRPADFRIKKALGFARNVSYDTLRHMLSGAYEIDRNIKKGVFDPKLALEYYISNN